MSGRDSIISSVVNDIENSLGFRVDERIVRFIISSYFNSWFSSRDDKDIRSTGWNLYKEYESLDVFDKGILKESLKGSIQEYSKDIMCDTLKRLYDVVSSTHSNTSLNRDRIVSKSICTPQRKKMLEGIQPAESYFDFDMDFSSIPKSSSVGVSAESVRREIENERVGKQVSSSIFKSSYRGIPKGSVFSIDLDSDLDTVSSKPSSVDVKSNSLNVIDKSSQRDDEGYFLQRSDASIFTDNSGYVPKSISDVDVMDY